MNNTGNYTKGNRIEILKALYVGGCLPYRCLELLPGSKQLAQRKALRMARENLIYIQSTKCGKCIFLNKKEEIVDEYRAYMPDSYFEHEQENRERLRRTKYESNRLERLQKNAEISLIMHLSNIATYPDEQLGEWLPGTNLASTAKIYIDRLAIKGEETYNAKIYENKKDGEKKVIGSRVSGIMISPGGNYAVYNLTNHLIEWERAGEVKMAGYLERYIRSIQIKKDEYYEQEEILQPLQEIECILFANNMDLFARVIKNENEVRGKKKKRKPLINIDYAYRIMYGLPTNKDGILMLKVMQEKDWKKKMERLLLPNHEKNIADYTVECDGYNEEDGYVLLYCTCDIAKLKLFLKRAVNAREGEKFSIYSFTFQLPLLEKFDLSGIVVKAMELNDYIKLSEDLK